MTCNSGFWPLLKNLKITPSDLTLAVVCWTEGHNSFWMDICVFQRLPQSHSGLHCPCRCMLPSTWVCNPYPKLGFLVKLDVNVMWCLALCRCLVYYRSIKLKQRAEGLVAWGSALDRKVWDKIVGQVLLPFLPFLFSLSSAPFCYFEEIRSHHHFFPPQATECGCISVACSVVSRNYFWWPTWS